MGIPENISAPGPDFPKSGGRQIREMPGSDLGPDFELGVRFSTNRKPQHRMLISINRFRSQIEFAISIDPNFNHN